jgi:hypothetical protein
LVGTPRTENIEYGFPHLKLMTVVEVEGADLSLGDKTTIEIVAI